MFVALTVGASVPFWLLGSDRVADRLGVGLPISSLMACCPALAAMALVRRQDPPGGVRRLLARALDYQRIPGRRWYVPAVLLMPAVMAGSYALPRLSGAALPEPRISPGAVGAYSAVFVLSAVAEQIGWTGYATAPLQARWGALAAGVSLGAVWALWHVVPYRQLGHDADWIVWQCLFTVALRIIITWLYVQTDSILATSLCHASSNVGWAMFFNHGSRYDPAVAAAIAWPVAIVLTVTARAKMLPPHLTTVPSPYR